MRPARKRVGGGEPAARAIEALERGAANGVRVARSLHRRWRTLSAEDRGRLRPLAEDLKNRALDLRGEVDRGAAEDDLRDAGERLADAMVERAAADPDVSEIEVHDLRADLTRELDRLAGAEIRASRGPGADAPGDARGPGAASGDAAPVDGQG